MHNPTDFALSKKNVRSANDSSRQFVIPFSFFYILNSYTTFYTLAVRSRAGEKEIFVFGYSVRKEENQYCDIAFLIANRVEE